MQCKKCKKECMESELTNCYCQTCWEKYKDNPTELKNIKNPTATTIRNLSTFVRIIGCIVTAILLFVIAYSYDIIIALIVAIVEVFTLFVVAILLDGFAEIIQLLENLNNK